MRNWTIILGAGTVLSLVIKKTRLFRQFVKDGVDQGQRPEFQGGSGTGMQKDNHEKSDGRILGSGAFVLEVLRESGEELHKRALNPPSLEDIAAKVGNYFNVPFAALGSKSRRKCQRSDVRFQIETSVFAR